MWNGMNEMLARVIKLWIWKGQMVDLEKALGFSIHKDRRCFELAQHDVRSLSSHKHQK